MNLRTLDGLELEGKKILLRCDFNVPFDFQGKVLDTTKIERHKMVYCVLQEEMKEAIHALSMKTLTLEESKS